MGSGVVQDEDEDPVQHVNPGAEEVVSHSGILVGVKLHWQLMDVDLLLAEDVRISVVAD